MQTLTFNPLRFITAAFALVIGMTISFAANAQPVLSGDVDLILPPVLASSDAPFYRGAAIKVGNDVLPVTEAATSNGELAEYQPEQNQVVVSNAANASEEDKARALLEVVSAMQASAIATAAGQ